MERVPPKARNPAALDVSPHSQLPSPQVSPSGKRDGKPRPPQCLAARDQSWGDAEPKILSSCFSHPLSSLPPRQGPTGQNWAVKPVPTSLAEIKKQP